MKEKSTWIFHVLFLIGDIMEKIITIEGKKIKMKASALLPRIYRAKFGRDMIVDMRHLHKKYTKAVNDDMTDEEKADAEFNVLDLTMFENIAWLMMKHGGNDVGESPEEWLDTLDGVFSIYEILPSIFELWNMNNKTTSTPKKK